MARNRQESEVLAINISITVKEISVDGRGNGPNTGTLCIKAATFKIRSVAPLIMSVNRGIDLNAMTYLNANGMNGKGHGPNTGVPCMKSAAFKLRSVYYVYFD